MSGFFFQHLAEPMETDEKKPFVKPVTMPAKKKTSEEQGMTCERLFVAEDSVWKLLI